MASLLLTFSTGVFQITFLSLITFCKATVLARLVFLTLAGKVTICCQNFWNNQNYRHFDGKLRFAQPVLAKVKLTINWSLSAQGLTYYYQDFSDTLILIVACNCSLLNLRLRILVSTIRNSSNFFTIWAGGSTSFTAPTTAATTTSGAKSKKHGAFFMALSIQQIFGYAPKTTAHFS